MLLDQVKLVGQEGYAFRQKVAEQHAAVMACLWHLQQEAT